VGRLKDYFIPWQGLGGLIKGFIGSYWINGRFLKVSIPKIIKEGFQRGLSLWLFLPFFF